MTQEKRQKMTPKKLRGNEPPEALQNENVTDIQTDASRGDRKHMQKICRKYAENMQK